MICITSNVGPTKAPPRTHRTRNDAIAAAVAEIGPHARNGFEFEATKCDGAWRWRALDEVRPQTPAELKAAGGKKSILAMALTIEGANGAETAMATTTDGKITPAKLPVPPRRIGTHGATKATGGVKVPRPAPAGAAGATSGGGATQEPPKPETLPALSPTTVEGTIAVGDKITYPDGSEGRVIATLTVPADPLDIPAALRRPKQTEQEKEAVRAKLKAEVGPDRKIKNPPDMKAATKRAEKREAAEAKVPGTPPHAKAKAAAKKLAGKPPVSKKSGSSTKAPPAKKLASESRAKPAGASGQTKTAMIGEMLLRKSGCTTAEVLAATGWPAVGMPAQAKAAGLNLRKEKVQGEPTRYFGSK